MNRRDKWRTILEAEMQKWSAKSCDRLISELRDVQCYEVRFDSEVYQVEVELLENTGTYVHVMVAVDDGTLPASFRPLTATFVREKPTQPA
jgi:hypothetical protein